MNRMEGETYPLMVRIHITTSVPQVPRLRLLCPFQLSKHDVRPAVHVCAIMRARYKPYDKVLITACELMALISHDSDGDSWPFSSADRHSWATANACVVHCKPEIVMAHRLKARLQSGVSLASSSVCGIHRCTSRGRR